MTTSLSPIPLTISRPTRPFDQETKCVWVVATPDYEPELCSITLPTIKRWAQKIGAEFKLISERAFPDFPVNYERVQIYKEGRDFFWNINVDADFLIHPEFPDFTSWLDPTCVGCWLGYDFHGVFNDWESNRFFARDRRRFGVVDCFLTTSPYTHDLWEPLPGSMADYSDAFLDGKMRRISEYCVSMNLAKYGLKIGSVLNDAALFLHIDRTSKGVETPHDIARAKLKEWGQV